MPAQTDVSKHYSHGGLIEAIRAGLASLGKTPETVTVDDLAPVDEFHIGGRRASEDFLDQLGFSAQTHVLDVGCGLGGPARFVASRYGSRVTGIDLTPEYVETGNALCKWVGLDQRISLHHGSALAMPFADSSFDGAYMLHVGMNIEDKEKLAVEVGSCAAAGLHLRNLRRDANGTWRPHLPGSLGNDRRPERRGRTGAVQGGAAEGGVHRHRRTQPA